MTNECCAFSYNTFSGCHCAYAGASPGGRVVGTTCSYMLFVYADIERLLLQNDNHLKNCLHTTSRINLQHMHKHSHNLQKYCIVKYKNFLHFVIHCFIFQMIIILSQQPFNVGMNKKHVRVVPTTLLPGEAPA